MSKYLLLFCARRSLTTSTIYNNLNYFLSPSLAMIMAQIGALVLKLWDSPKLTWVDSLYAATVTATSVGFGDIVPQTNGGRIFWSVYMLVSTIVTAVVLSDFIDLYVEDYVGEGILEKIIDSTTWVHKADLDCDGMITESDYILFKLQQMQKVRKCSWLPNHSFNLA